MPHYIVIKHIAKTPMIRSSTTVYLPFPSLPPPGEGYEWQVSASSNQYMPRKDPNLPLSHLPPRFELLFMLNLVFADDNVGSLSQYFTLNRRTPAWNAIQHKSPV